METFCGVADKNPQKTSDQIDIRLNSLANAQPNLTHFPALFELQTLLSTSETSARLEQQVLDIDQLEMLGAELRNQGILSVNTDISLSQHAQHLVSILRWRANRLRVRDKLHFSVSIPKYILRCARENIEQLAIHTQGESTLKPDDLLLKRSLTWGKALESKDGLLRELDYLEQFAKYALGRFELASNKYQMGLNLLLEVLSNNHLALKESNAKQCRQIQLPIEVNELLNSLGLVNS